MPSKGSQLDESWRPKSKGDRCRYRDKDKFRDNFENITKACGCVMGERCDCDSSHRHKGSTDRS